jgi:hypothetical protein
VSPVLTDEQTSLVATVREFCARESGTRQQRLALAEGGPGGHSPQIAAKLAVAAGAQRIEVNHLRPLITSLSPSRTMLVATLRASDDATAGSVIATTRRWLDILLRRLAKSRTG